jgi:hypothetical protein
MTLLVGQHRLESVDDGIEGVDVAHVEVVGDRRRRIANREQTPLRASFHGDGAGADAVENLLGQAFGHHAIRGGVEYQSRGVGAGQPVVEPHQPVQRDRRHIDQHFRDHHEQDREDEEFSGKPKARCASRFRLRSQFIAHGKISPHKTTQQAYDATRRRFRQTFGRIGNCGAFPT